MAPELLIGALGAAVGGDRVWIYCVAGVYTGPMSKHLIDIDEKALSAARAELGTITLKDTVNEALRVAASGRDPRVAAALDILARAELEDRSVSWR